ncbi:MAG: hypothetical protein ACTSRA_11515 [Promethearchaeota archaeon]
MGKIKKVISTHIKHIFKCVVLYFIALNVTSRNYIQLGIGKYDHNLLFGPLAWLFTITTFLAINEIFRAFRDKSAKRRLALEFVLVAIFSTSSIIISTFHGLKINDLQNTVGAIVLLLIAWSISCLVYYLWKRKEIPKEFSSSVPFFLSLIHPALVNTAYIPKFLLLFAIAFLLSLLSREMALGCRDAIFNVNVHYERLMTRLGVKKSILGIKLLQILTIIMLSLTFISKIYNFMLYSLINFISIMTSIFLLLSLLIKRDISKNMIRSALRRARIVIAFEITSLIFAGM